MRYTGLHRLLHHQIHQHTPNTKISNEVNKHFALCSQRQGGLWGWGGGWKLNCAVQPGRLRRPETAARTTPVLRQCPHAIAQWLAYYTIAVSTACTAVETAIVTRTMSIALLLSNNWSKRSPPFWSLAIVEQLVYYAVAVSTAVWSRVTRTVSVALLLSNKWSRKVQLSEPSSTSPLLISSGLSWGSSTTSLLLISPGPTDESLTSLWEFSSSPSSWSHLDSLSNLMLLHCCFTSTETIGLLGTGAQDNHLDFRTAPELWLYLTRHFNALCTLHCKMFWSSASERFFKIK